MFQGRRFYRTFASTSAATRDKLHRVALTQRATPVSLLNLYHFGKQAAKDPMQRLRNAQFLHNELQVRIAQRVLELERLPLGMAQTKHVRDVIGWFTEYFHLISNHPYPNDEPGEEAFTKMLKVVLQDHNSVVETMARGALEVKSKPDFDSSSRATIDSVLSRFYMARIGLRFLIEHHIQSTAPQDGFAGIIQSRCSPIECVEKAAAEATMICNHHLGEAPDVEVIQIQRDGTRKRKGDGGPDITFTYVPGHLVYMLSEVLKNASRATVETHGGKSLPPIRVIIVDGSTDVTIRISDEGGGIKRKQLDLIWSYLHTTAKSPLTTETAPGGGSNVPALAGYGVGLPLSRLYARYFGGDLAIKSLEGFGTDVYLHVSRLGHDCENLPEGVLQSPAERDSSLLRGMSSTVVYTSKADDEEATSSSSSK